MITKTYKTKISQMGDKLIMNVPKAVWHHFKKGENIIFLKEEDYNEEQKKFRFKNNK